MILRSLGLVAVLASALPAQQTELTPAQLTRVTPIVRVAQEVGPAVVNVYQEVLHEVELPFPYNRFMGGRRTSRSTSLGSGVIIDEEGFILTNAHVLKNSQDAIQVRLRDGNRYQAQLVNLDTQNDIALLKVDAPTALPAARLGTSSDVLVGETVVAIGNPLGNENTVTSGIVSSIYRDVRVPGRRARTGAGFQDFIQLDAAINPGNSGGPLLNVNGEVIGINWAIASQAEGIGFAIPIDRVRTSLLDILVNPLVVNEIVTGLSVTGDSRGRNVRLADVRPDGPGERAGLRAGDLLLSVGDTSIDWEFDFPKALFDARPGEAVEVVVQRGDRVIPVDLVLDAKETPMQFIRRKLGMRVVDHPHYFGVLVDSVDRDSPAASLPFRKGDLIDGVNRQNIDDTLALYEVLRGLGPGAELQVNLFRDGVALMGAVRLPTGR